MTSHPFIKDILKNYFNLVGIGFPIRFFFVAKNSVFHPKIIIFGPIFNRFFLTEKGEPPPPLDEQLIARN